MESSSAIYTVPTGRISRTCWRIAESGAFQGFIFAVIVANAITLGLQTYDSIEREVGGLLDLLDAIFLGIFVVELAIRITAYGRHPQNFFRDGWNVFDFVVIAAAFAPGVRENATLLRIVRLLRVVRLVTVLPDLRIVLKAMAHSVPPITGLAILTILLMYVYGMIGWILFHEDLPNEWGTIGQSMLNLFVVLTLESWPDLLQDAMDVHRWSWIYFVSYVLLASFLVINMLIGIVINSMEEVRAAEREQLAEKRRRRKEREAQRAGREPPVEVTALQRVREMKESLLELEQKLVEVEGGGPKIRRPGMRP
jgi:voltage-gated sodium channel